MIKNIDKICLIRGSYFEAISGQNLPGRFLDFVDASLINLGLPLPKSCCYTGIIPTNGQVLAWNSLKKIYEPTTIIGGGVTNLSGTPTSIDIVIANSAGTGYTIPLANVVNSGLLSPVLFTFINNLNTIGFFSTQSITGNGLSATPFKLLNDSAAPGNSFYYGTNASGIKGWYVLSTGSFVGLSGEATSGTTGSLTVLDNTAVINKVLTGINVVTQASVVATDSIVQAVGKLQATKVSIADVSTSFQLIQLIPTATNVLPTLSPLPINNLEVIISVNGIRVYNNEISVSNLGVFTVNSINLGYNLDITDTVTCIYFGV